LDDGLSFDDLIIAQGEDSNVSHTIIRHESSGEYLAIIQDTSVDNITALDFVSTSTDAQTLDGTPENNTLIGGTGEDIANGYAGSDTIYGWGGNDTINITNKTGAFTDTINGGAGTDTLNINYSGITSLKDFTISKSGEVTTLIDSSGGTVNYESIENLTVNGIPYITSVDQYSPLLNLYLSASENILISSGSDVSWNASLILGGDYGLSLSDDITYYGSAAQDTINLSFNREYPDYEGNLTINTGAGNDTILSAKLKNADSIDLGAGDDSISIMVSGDYGTPSLYLMNIASLDGGSGNDTLSFEESTVSNGATLSLTTGGATNFENLTGSASIETLNGDANANTIKGNGGADNLYGMEGDDILYGYTSDIDTNNEKDNLYGGSGDDQLYGTAGENILDGGTGKDTLTGGDAIDTFVIRIGDGSTTLVDADVITDFEDGIDVIGLDDGLSFDDLIIAQGEDSNVSHTIIRHESSGEYLAIVEGINVTELTEFLDFTPFIDIL
jgi:Ca2+-binding RTX toxin-like protein